jgi:deoxycytidylate deaminase
MSKRALAGKPPANQVETGDFADAASAISARLSQELVFAFVGPVASGVSTSADLLRSELVRYGYEVMPDIKLSRFIGQEAHRVGMPANVSGSINNRIEHLQNIGNELRKKFGPDYLAKKAVRQIAEVRIKDGYEEVVAGAIQRPRVVRRAWIIDSLKNEAELSLLRSVYKQILLLIGVFAPDHVRRQRLKTNKGPEKEIEPIMIRDQGDELSHGQQVRSLFVKSDFFIRNDKSNKAYLSKVIKRYVELIFSVGLHTPTVAESAMHEASSVASKSACLSRQVGAAIVDETGQLISVGWNDVPKFGGGLYTEDDQNRFDSENNEPDDQDHRCFRFEGAICHNDSEKKLIEEKLITSIRNAGIVDENLPDEVISFALRGSGIESLIEFSRSIHAEMEAILSVARDSRHSLEGATLYSTTYPCHNCARHIVASGIREVIYIQPYRKSLALKLHHDSISENETDRRRVIFKQYQGVAPNHFERLFRQSAERKKNGRYLSIWPTLSHPMFRESLDSFTAYELKVMEQVLSIEVAG